MAHEWQLFLALHTSSARAQGDDQHQLSAILLSLEACAACLQVLSAPNMPKQVYKEELIDRSVSLMKYHLLKNVLVFYDASICQANRPNLLEEQGALHVQQTLLHKPSSHSFPLVHRQLHHE